MSWSNLLDFYTPQEFHTLARTCSKRGGTVPFGSSMNWPINVRGISVVDFSDAGERARV
jgi:hypothetical protein